MGKSYYTDYVRHCLRYYTRNDFEPNASKAEKINWICCDDVFKELGPKEREILKHIYREKDTMADNVFNICKTLGLEQNQIWASIRDLERLVAESRTLI